MASKAETFPSGADVGALVVDLGSQFVRAGNAGDDCPKFFSHSCIGENVEGSGDVQMTDDVKQRLEFPVSFASLRNNFDVRPCLSQQSKTSPDCLWNLDSVLAPVEPVRLDKEAFYTMLHHIFNSEKGLQEGLKGKPVILSEPNKHNRDVRESMAEVLFENCEVEAVYTVKGGVLTSFAVGRTGGLVVDIGAYSTTITAIQDGYTLQNAEYYYKVYVSMTSQKNVIELPIGGHLLEYQLSTMLKQANLDCKVVPLFSVRKEVRIVPNMPSIVDNVKMISTSGCRPSFLSYSRQEVLRWMKESIAHTAENPLRPEERSGMVPIKYHAPNTHLNHSRYELPDGTCIDTKTLSKIIPECIFDFEAILGRNTSNGCLSPLPSSLQGFTSVLHAVAHCVQSCDVDYRRDLLGALIFSGGCSLIPGLTERATRQLQEADNAFASGLKYKVVCPVSSLERRFLPWIGGSILASLSSFQQMWMSRSEYEEHGIGLLERRCIQ